jgi:hypothetical protein
VFYWGHNEAKDYANTKPMKQTTHQYAGVHEEFVRVLQNASTLYRFGSDRINNADHYLQSHAYALLDFETPELHPDTCQMYRCKAAAILKAQGGAK